ncbi:LysR family transcriptional regulator [Agrobacterium rosae]|uniref:HTH-type transcriptional regulator TtuA n=1 Tax=Agrobacterium rosae TaxID=1972867 RepID=A0AAE5RZR7_9HYPH|nr:LysR family transcriptional regulator [Agrobacterium rosae]KAA3509536.1 LysR family transcriptional regulator [Agrobacterium rosae]KAA3516436.1 LysR family transcriptional regulator [Agrobacterium rosae]MBN7808401.1 LysR family transcriptional regulator [Agrobacterium rosae]MCM2434947.1 LysR family transcriptional regulator [Agrobacterium rosae]MDX8315151.1 LysR family transcriptional regulator [Agrobacterium rosae]
MSITLKQLDYFIASAESGQVSHAAVNLNISQSAVTAAIKALEEELGVKLLERTHAGVRLTMEGSRFLEHARIITGAVAAAVHSPLRGREGYSGKLTLGMTYTVTGYFMSKYYARFRKTYPQISVELKELPRTELERQLACGDIDIALMLVSNLGNMEELEQEVLMRSSRRLWLSADHHLLLRNDISLADIAQEDYVMLTVDEASETAARYWDQAGLKPRTVLTTSSVEAVRSLVAAGVGVTILSDMVYRPWSLEGQRIELKRLVEQIPSMDVGLAWARARPIASAAATFRGFMSVTMGGGG